MPPMTPFNNIIPKNNQEYATAVNAGTAKIPNRKIFAFSLIPMPLIVIGRSDITSISGTMKKK